MLRPAVLILCALLLAGCGGALEPVIPTAPPTPTPGPTATPAPASPLPRITAPPPSPTRDPALDLVTPTPLLGFVPTPALAAPATQANSAAITLVRVEYFTADPTTATTGSVITLFWGVQGVDTATIYRVEANGERRQAWAVPRTGSLQVVIRETTDGIARFLLVAGTASQQLEIPAGCTEAWFFEPAAPTCPDGPPLVGTAAQQSFERGLLVWFGASRTIYALFEDKATPAWSAFPDEFVDGQPESDPSLQPPEGKLQPVRGFGRLWRTNPEVRRRLGWASGPEQPFDGALQLSGGAVFLRLRDGGVAELAANGETWGRR